MFKSMHIDETLAALREARERHGSGSIVVFHSRWATHGITTEFNVHPFYTDGSGETIMVHNGVLPTKYHPLGDDPRSDTRIFADRVLHDYTINGVPSRRKSKELGKMIGSGNKLIFLSVVDGEPKARIVNAYLGEHAYGAWFSNSGYLPSRWTWKGWTSPITAIGRSEDEVEWDAKEPSDWDWVDQAEADEYYSTVVCRHCEGIGGVDSVSGICEYCETCYDCSMSIVDCQCYPSLWRPTEVEVTN